MALFRNAATVLTTSVVAIPLGFVASLILARFLSVGDRGSYGLAVNFATLVFVVAQLGLPAAVIFEHRRGRCPPARMLTTHLAANLATGVIAALLCLLLPSALRQSLLPGASDEVWALSLAMVPPLVLGEFLRAAARALDRFDLHNAFTLLQPVALVVALLAAVVLGGGGLIAALVAYLAVQVGLALWLLVALARITGFEPTLQLAELGRSLRYGLTTYGQHILVHLQERLELFLVAWLLADSVQVGLYAVALSAASPFRMMPNALSVAVFPELAEHSPARAAETTAMLTRHSVVWTAVLVLAMLPFLPWLVPALFGAPYTAAVPTALWLLPGVIVLAASRLLARYFQAIDQQRALLFGRSLAVVTNGSLGLWWIPSGGIVGAAQAALAANAIELAVVGYAFCAATGLGPRAAFAPRRADLEPYRVRVEGLARRLRSSASLR